MRNKNYKDAEFDVLKGKVLKNVYVHDGDSIVFVCEDGVEYEMFHYQNCCERVTIYNIDGNLESLIGNPIVMAEVASNSNDEPLDGDLSYTWTFYKLATCKGYVTIRWYGTSNGYYSESVDFFRVED